MNHHAADDTEAVRAALARMGLARPGEEVAFERLTGGVSSDIWKVKVAGRAPFCVKRALAQLRVAQEWTAPVARNAYEIAWIETAATVIPDHVPRLLGVDAGAGLFAMEYLDPARHALWKDQLRGGEVNLGTARAVAGALARVHGASAGQRAVAERFPTDDIFYAIRLEPYLVAAARRHPGLAPALHDLVERTARTKLALVHGDVSPKNILVGEHGPIFLDAECAWYGDPAFDAAFCLNHLLLKCLWTPAATPRFLACFDAFASSYLERVTWEPRDGLEARAARLLPGLFLARIDGKSPVEYVTEERDRDRVRAVAGQLLRQPPQRLSAVRAAWAAELRR